eukprot:5689553-Pyramimonas_sp.AAC.1
MLSARRSFARATSSPRGSSIKFLGERVGPTRLGALSRTPFSGLSRRAGFSKALLRSRPAMSSSSRSRSPHPLSYRSCSRQTSDR